MPRSLEAMLSLEVCFKRMSLIRTKWRVVDFELNLGCDFWIGSALFGLLCACLVWFRDV